MEIQIQMRTMVHVATPTMDLVVQTGSWSIWDVTTPSHMLSPPTEETDQVRSIGFNFVTICYKICLVDDFSKLSINLK